MTVDTTLINAAKLAARIKTNAFDSQVSHLLNAALLDMGVAGVEIPEATSALVTQAAITYFLMHFGSPDEYDRLKASYNEQKGQLSTCTGYTRWEVSDGQI